MSFDTELTAKLRERLEELDKNAKDTVVRFRLSDFSEYRYSAGYCQGLADAKTILDELSEDLQKS